MEEIYEIPPEEDEEAIKVAQAQLVYEQEKEAKEALSSMTVKQHNVEFDANEKAQNNMTSVVAIVNWQFNSNIHTMLDKVASNPALPDEAKMLIQGLSQGFEALYKEVYKTEVFWKGADSKAHKVQAETIAEALFATMSKKAGIIKDTVK